MSSVTLTVNLQRVCRSSDWTERRGLRAINLKPRRYVIISVKIFLIVYLRTLFVFPSADSCLFGTGKPPLRSGYSLGSPLRARQELRLARGDTLALYSIDLYEPWTNHRGRSSMRTQPAWCSRGNLTLQSGSLRLLPFGVGEKQKH